MALLAFSPQVLIGVLFVVAVLVAVTILANLAWRLCSNASIPANLPWAGVESTGGPLSRARASLRSISGMKALMDEGYYNYSKRNQAYVLPHILTGPEVVLPPSQVRWLLEQPDTVLSQTEVNRRFLEADHTFPHPNIVREPVHPGIIRRELTHQLRYFAADIADELDRSFRERWGVETSEWREVRVYDTLLDVISRLSVRVLVGEELCRNDEFLSCARRFDKNVVVSAAVLNLLPEFLKPVFGPIITAYDKMLYRTFAKHVMPLIKERLSESADKQSHCSPRRRNDYFEWAISHAKAHWDPKELSPEVMAGRLACLCFAAIQSSVISMTNALFDLAASPAHSAEWFDAMRDEVLQQQQQENVHVATTATTAPAWTSKAALARLRRVDSALRESMRLSGFVARGVMKSVVARDGVRLPDGTHLPPGANVGFQAYSVHRDEDVYRGATEYRPFRFVDEDSCTGEKQQQQQQGPPHALVSTSSTFLAFSHGANACPGRFFAANQMKLTLAYIALHYEIQPIAERPPNKWFVGSMAPPMWDTLKIRRRKP
ncbi:hypothetical protein MAPG_04602 [Magnaporthiopsis poae ATCC 64411]|uniref:Cytochrome P450 n=1 Tax=Magnaporthiopsis poae (strain ATCC 64411 / 73-15) TaxID=644358 RepID=A0A0C4DX64_MAGP6|nr:hypothetical protein MAPG_04602 [Magnaporthiopsis poae ATCC 64411]